MIKKVVLLTEQSQADFLNKLWLEGNLQPGRLPLCSAGFIGCDGYDFPLVAYWNCDSLGSYGWDKFENAKRHAQFITFDKFVELDEIKAMNLDKIETQEEKEAFNGMANSSEVPNSSEWKNGETCYVKDCSHDEIIFVGLSKNKSVAVCECVTNHRSVIMDKFWVSDLLKEKPETPEQKAERERLEAAYDLYGSMVDYDECAMLTYCQFKESEYLNGWLKVVDKTGYRKQNG